MKLLQIKITIKDTETLCENGHELEVEMTPSEALSIDKLEKIMLSKTYETIRCSLSNHLEAESKKKAKSLGNEYEHDKMIKVKGEVGRFNFRTWLSDNGEGLYPPRNGCYKTKGYLESGVYYGACDLSYRQGAEAYNRRVAQEKGISATSLQSDAKQEAKRVEKALTETTTNILKNKGFSKEGSPLGKKNYGETKTIEKAKIEAAYEQIRLSAPAKILPKLKKISGVYEERKNTVYIHLDDVCNKKQKASRKESEGVKIEKKKPKRKNGKKVYPKRRYLFHTVARVITNVGNYTLTSSRIKEVWPRLIAFLLYNKLEKMTVFFMVDGHHTLQDFITTRTEWILNYMLLDWYHLKKKLDKQLGMGMYKSEGRDRIIYKISQCLWYGLVDQAQEHLRDISSGIKKQQDIDDFITYLERNRNLIHNYAVRKVLGLPNSSNRVEKENDLVVSRRQKNSGASWTREGSDALATLTAVKRNKEVNQWLENDIIPFKLVA